jgi:predicted LPLAT superfamily acyltransferase
MATATVTGRTRSGSPAAAPPPRTGGPQRGGWQGVAERGSILGIRFFVWLSTALGRAAARFVLRFVVAYYVLFHASIRRASADYLRRVHGWASVGLVYAHVLAFAEVTLDRAFILRGKIDRFRVTRTGNRYLEQLVATRTGAILLGAHLGSFEAMRMQGSREGLAINVLGDFRNARMINEVLEAVSPGANARVIAIDPADPSFVLRIKERIARGELIAILGDRVVPEGRTATVDFLGGRAAFPTGAYVLAAVLRCPVYLTFGLYRRPDGYNLFCEPFAEAIELPRDDRDGALRAYAQKFAARLEEYVRRAPDNWFNFYDFWRE